MIKWIDCKERLPEKGQLCLLYRPEAPKTEDSIYRVAVFTGEHFACYVQPTHWAALTVPEVLSEHLVKCCVPTADEEVLLATGEYTPEELWGGPRPTCPKCIKGSQ